MGNNTSQIRKSGVTYNESNVRKSSTSQAGSNNQNLDEEFSDLILHEVKKDAGIKDRNVFNQSNDNSVGPGGSGHSHLAYNKFSNDLIEDEYNELNDLIETDETELSRNIIPDKEGSNDGNGNPMGAGDDMDIDTNESNTPTDEVSYTPDTPTPDLSTVNFTKIVSDSQSSRTQPIQQLGTLPNRGPVGNNSRPGNNNFQGSSGQNSPVYQATGMQQLQSQFSSGSLPSNDSNKLVQVEIKWVNITQENILKISIIGSFSNWRHIIRLRPSTSHPNEYVVTIKLPLGVHKLLYIINNEYRVSEQLPTATDQEGIFFNWFEVLDEQHLFNHSQNQPNRTNASTKYDANIIQSAGQFEINEIKRKSNSFLAKISKEEPGFEHVEYMDKDDSVDDLQKELQEELMQQQQRQQQHQQQQSQEPYSGDLQTQEFEVPVPHAHLHPVSSDKAMSPSDRYISLQEHNSSSFLIDEQMRTKVEYSNEIPEIFINYNYFKSQNADFELPEPPQLPAHLNNVLLNKISNLASNSNLPQAHAPNPHAHSHNHGHNHGPASVDALRPPSASFLADAGTSPLPGGSSGSSTGTGVSKRPPLRRADSSYYASNKEAYHLSIPNHVILNHLMTTSIRNDVLSVACITRYSGKFVTQIMHSPADTT